MIKFCPACGHSTATRIPAGDNRPRAVCESCGLIHYLNPKMVVGCLPVWEDRILICRRAIEPRHGKWTLPAGFMENNETAPEGAAREAMEEANAKVEIEDLYTLYSIPHISQVYMMFRARLLDPNVRPGDESRATLSAVVPEGIGMPALRKAAALPRWKSATKSVFSRGQ